MTGWQKDSFFCAGPLIRRIYVVWSGESRRSWFFHAGLFQEDHEKAKIPFRLSEHLVGRERVAVRHYSEDIAFAVSHASATVPPTVGVKNIVR
ncbi:hypothetical protein GMO_07310 [Gluconobacter morbifer G707]|uniref:Uncharacterized protein n=1 Tax=Gluconobacter morbifer G707 TaxID=1088869 RepID=G6XGW6_9PROT|nr:hypothetical protein GMO_07310 [Gluconobacter morbifer G707]